MIAPLLALLLQQVPPSGTEDALWERARDKAATGEHFEAYHLYRDFVLRFPQSSRASEAKRQEMTSALELARAGHATNALGVRLFATSVTGVEFLRDSLRRYPREDFAADFTQKLGMFYFRRSEWDAASLEFQTVLDQYPESPEAVLALYMMALTAEQRFDGIERDQKPTREARRLHERFLEEADRLRRLPDPAPRWVDELVPAVKARLARIYGLLLEKHLRTAEYYEWKEFPKAAAIYYRTILKDEASFRRVLPDPRDYPVHEGVQKARARLAEDAWEVSRGGSLRLLPALLLSTLGACGYQVGGLYPERDVRVETFDNISERRAHEFELTGSVVRELMARGFRVNGPAAPLVLRGRILDMRTPSVVDQVDTDQLLVGSLTVRLEVTLASADGRERWREERLERITFTPSRGEGFETARREAFDRLARWVVSHFEKEW